MPSFSQRYAPPPTPLGDEIPRGVRQAIAAWFRDRGVDADAVQRRFFQEHGYGYVDDVIDDVRDRWGADVATALTKSLGVDLLVEQWHAGDRRHAAATKVVPLYVPEALYLDYLEGAMSLLAEERAIHILDPLSDAVSHVNNLFARRGIHYRFTNTGDAEWHGDDGAYRHVTAPALRALEELYLASPRDEFTAALTHLRKGTPKDREDAIEEAAKAVESMMKIVLNERGIESADRPGAEALWNILREKGIVPPQTKDAILAASRLRNAFGGHGAGVKPRSIPEGVPGLAVQAAASSIVYLATHLPP